MCTYLLSTHRGVLHSCRYTLIRRENSQALISVEQREFFTEPARLWEPFLVWWKVSLPVSEVIFKVPSNPDVEMLLVSVSTEYHRDSGAKE